MGLARILTTHRLRYSALAAVACSGIIHSGRGRNRVYLDSAANASFSAYIGGSSAQGYLKGIQKDVGKPHPAEENTKKGDAEIVDQTNDPDTYAPGFEDDDTNAWKAFSRNLDNIKEGASRLEWTDIGDRIANFVLPSWASSLPGAIQKLRLELSMEPGSLADDIWQEAHDADINPEILWNANVRVGDTLSHDEMTFRQRRREHMVPAFAKYLGIKEDEIDPEDIPTIAVCGSGGGLRALVAGTSSYLCTQEAGLFDCVMYTAGVSGSCWLQSLYYSSLGRTDHRQLLNHIKSRIGTHIAFPPPALKLVTSAPTNKFILSGFVEKLKGNPDATFNLVDVYSLMLAARLMVPKGDLDVRDNDLKLSNQRDFLQKGEHPMPIYTVVRHEIPVLEEKKKNKSDNPADKAKAEEKARREAWFQWIEMTPWEVFCEEFGAGIPTWALGRPFENGVNKLLDTGIALPEIRQSLLLGIYGSAFCATLSHYYKEIRPLLTGLKGFSGVDELLEGKKDDLIRIHPIEPATIPNWVYGMKGQLPETCPASVFESKNLQVMDAGMSNNLPIYPLLRPGRDVDVLIAFDASADIQKENWLSVVDGYAKQRGLKSWPLGTGWPQKSNKPEENAKIMEETKVKSPQAAASKVAEAREEQRKANPGEDGKAVEQKASSNEKQGLNKSGTGKKEAKESTGESPTTGESNPDTSTDLSYCNIWVGVKQERNSTEEPPQSKRVSWDNPDDSSFALMEPDASLAVIYFPLLPNPKVDNIHPDKTDFLSTWNFIYTPEQVDKVIELAKRNFEAGEDATRRTVRGVYERNKRLRIEKEEQYREKMWKRRHVDGGDTFSGVWKQ